MPRERLRTALNGHDNALNLVRLVLATAVIVHHCWPIGFGSATPRIVDSFVAWAVPGFFAISGYLIAGSRMRLGFAPFLWRRFLRIYPGFWACLVVVAFAIAPASTLLTGVDFNPRDGLSYVLRNVSLWIFQWTIGDTLASAPNSAAWNGSLWTLPYEFAAYVCAGVLLGFVVARRAPAAMCGALLAMTTLAQIGLLVTSQAGWFPIVMGLELGGYFLAGMVLFFLSDRLPVSSWLAVGCALALPPLFLLGIGNIAGPLPAAYLMLWTGARIRLRLGARNDISYGVYIYAFPVQQVLALAGVPRFGPVLYTLLSALGTLPLALGSWFVIERHAMRLRSRTAGAVRRLQPNEVATLDDGSAARIGDT